MATTKQVVWTGQLGGTAAKTQAVKAKCSTFTEAECGAGKIKDTSQDSQDCAGDPCVGSDAQTCCKEARYVLGDGGQNDCPSGYKNILTQGACEMAAQTLGYVDRNYHGVDPNTRPKGR